MTIKIEDLDVALQEQARRDQLAGKLTGIITRWLGSPEGRTLEELCFVIGDRYRPKFTYPYSPTKTFVFAPKHTLGMPFWILYQSSPQLLSIQDFARLWLAESEYQEMPEQALETLKQAIDGAMQKAAHDFRMDCDAPYVKQQRELREAERREEEAIRAAVRAADRKLFLGAVILILVVVACCIALFTYYPLG